MRDQYGGCRVWGVRRARTSLNEMACGLIDIQSINLIDSRRRERISHTCQAARQAVSPHRKKGGRHVQWMRWWAAKTAHMAKHNINPNDDPSHVDVGPPSGYATLARLGQVPSLGLQELTRHRRYAPLNSDFDPYTCRLKLHIDDSQNQIASILDSLMRFYYLARSLPLHLHPSLAHPAGTEGHNIASAVPSYHLGLSENREYTRAGTVQRCNEHTEMNRRCGGMSEGSAPPESLCMSESHLRYRHLLYQHPAQRDEVQGWEEQGHGAMVNMDVHARLKLNLRLGGMVREGVEEEDLEHSPFHLRTTVSNHLEPSTALKVLLILTQVDYRLPTPWVPRFTVVWPSTVVWCCLPVNIDFAASEALTDSFRPYGKSLKQRSQIGQRAIDSSARTMAGNSDSPILASALPNAKDQKIRRIAHPGLEVGSAGVHEMTGWLWGHRDDEAAPCLVEA
ncbi:hypothetical protein FIBSPDRAFT_990574 [Athelia psychrophila]|uniref:Uncharacterized protein n=1 Tax=Athelia psychrophila TaxID=1759441 RepID=A0A166SA36_9AGAM|nr:hypothetical protein FIBSPDRAFT_990574 [Fibularhizoctonia sp. CBS 109695]